MIFLQSFVPAGSCGALVLRNDGGLGLIYAIYLIHSPLLLLFLRWGWMSEAWFPVYLSVYVRLSLLSFYCFETPVREWMLKRFHTRPLETMAVASIAQ